VPDRSSPDGNRRRAISLRLSGTARAALASACCTPPQDVLKQLQASRADNAHDKHFARLAEVDLLVIDDLGLRPLEGQEPIDLYELIRLRCERGSTIITSNRDTDELHQLFGDPIAGQRRHGSPAAQRPRLATGR
jgi:DNA replication protein DnaC